MYPKAKRKTVLSDDDASYSEGDEDDVDDDDEGNIEVQVPTLIGNNIEWMILSTLPSENNSICFCFTKKLHCFVAFSPRISTVLRT